jgi:hypothetical protein
MAIGSMTSDETGSKDDRGLSETIISAIAENMDSHPENITPLYESVDPDSLDNIFSGERQGKIIFEHTGFRIIVYRDGEVDINEVDE